MGYDLKSYDGEELNMGMWWAERLDLARTYGWEPCGTTNPAADLPWSGGYLSNDYQIYPTPTPSPCVMRYNVKKRL
jgi:hypothetical protein